MAWKNGWVHGINRGKYIWGAISKMPSTRNSLVFEDANAFKKVNAKYDEKWLVNRNFIENDVSLLELVLNIHDLDKDRVNFEDMKIVKLPLWLYCKTREVFLEKFWIKFQLGKDSYDITKNFIRIYLEDKDEDHIVINDILLYPNCFVYRYLNEITDNSYRYNDGEGVFSSEFHYP